MLFSLYYLNITNDFYSERSKTDCARKLLFQSLQNEGIFDYSESDILIGKSGKPYFKDNKIFFNISHSQNYILCGISDSNIGVDIEEKRDALKRVAKKILSDDENRLFETMSENEKTDFLLKKWVMNEAYSKFTSLGVRQIFNSRHNFSQVSENLYKTKASNFLHPRLFPSFALCAASEYETSPKIINVDNTFFTYIVDSN